MLHRFRERFGTAGLVVAVLALVLALTGGAFAAGGGLTGKQKKEVKTIAKSFQGTGPQGPQGSPGTNGTNGTNGKDGAAGDDGKSVTVTGIPPEEEECEELGGAEVKVEGAAQGTDVCNGAPWTAGGTLPSQQTETGSWGGNAVNGYTFFPVNFSIPLPAPLNSSHAIGIKQGGTIPLECENTAHAGAAGATNPEADPGYLCVYTAFDGDFVINEEEAHTPAVKDITIGAFPFSTGASKAGAFVYFGGGLEAIPFLGTYAVTAP